MQFFAMSTSFVALYFLLTDSPNMVLVPTPGMMSLIRGLLLIVVASASVAQSRDAAVGYIEIIPTHAVLHSVRADSPTCSFSLTTH